MFETYVIASSFEPGDTLYLQSVGTVPVVGRKDQIFWTKGSKTLGVAVEPIFNFGPESSIRLCVEGAEIRLYSLREDRIGPVVGFISSFKNQDRVRSRSRSALYRRLSRLFASDGLVVAIFMVVLLVLGFSIGAIVAILFL